MKKISFFFLIFIFLNINFALSDSIYQSVHPKFSLFSDREPKKIGDIIVILVSEKASAKGQAETKTGKDTSVSGGPGTGLLDFVNSWGLSTKEKSEGKGSTNRTTSFVTTISARIVDILPNGILKIEGGQVLTINNEKQTITISGVIRQEDISINNTIYSYQIADAQIKYDGKGPISRKQKEGILSKILGLIF